eukprot:5846138-Pyramimonas_sp.AAC.1
MVGSFARLLSFPWVPGEGLVAPRQRWGGLSEPPAEPRQPRGNRNASKTAQEAPKTGPGGPLMTPERLPRAT